MSCNRIVVIGGSAGSIAPLRTIASGYPPGFKAATVIAIHMPATSPSELAEILRRQVSMPVSQARDRMELREGQIYVGTPDWHVLVERDHLHLSHGPKENHSRPALNPLFRSAAIAYEQNAIGVILSGVLDDGVAGLWEMKRRGGIVIAQQPEDAIHPDMPSNAIQAVKVDYIRRAAEIAPLLENLVDDMAESHNSSNASDAGMRTEVTCPECRGPMWKYTEGNRIEFRCRVKHSYSAKSMLEAHAETEERSQWAAVVALEEGADLLEQLNAGAPSGERTAAAEQARAKRELARKIRDVLEANSTRSSSPRD